MSFENLMKSFARQNNLEEIDFRDNKYHLILDGITRVTCFQANGDCYFHGILAPLPEDSSAREDLLVRLLKTNLALMQSQRMSLCIEPDGRNLGLYLTRPLRGLDETMLTSALVEYVNGFEVFKKEVDRDDFQMFSGMMMLP
ncbi:MAG: CesT family type III secretion system chaperone [Candidatus Endonucleobacter bathymodioli]|uniref:CesT family type III secretion system chaperone n=1 Tax=Candidatus Endonucleibacter bathymodioli TaxID=539814 RepID=A0AA90NKI1_9GAMM|nr:CesT family type III secretion system chaperone [Candidatus Endonucleobacter bathymodioli]